MKNYLFDMTFKGIPVRFHWSCLLIIFMVFSPSSSFLIIMLSLLSRIFLILLHEFGHAFFILKAKREVLAVEVHCLGGFCEHQGGGSVKEQFLIASGGIIFQLMLLLLTAALLSIPGMLNVPLPAIVSDFLGMNFIYINFIFILINLIPMGGLDGRKILSLGRILFKNRKPFSLKNIFSNRKRSGLKLYDPSTDEQEDTSRWADELISDINKKIKEKCDDERNT